VLVAESRIARRARRLAAKEGPDRRAEAAVPALVGGFAHLSSGSRDSVALNAFEANLFLWDLGVGETSRQA
jgi:hypothetical protein